MHHEFPPNRANTGAGAPATPPARWERPYPTDWHIELFLTLCSAWAAAQMWLWPTEFSIGHVATSWSGALSAREQSWAIFCGIAAMLKLAGLVSRLWAYHDPRSGRLMICSFCTRFAVGCTIVGLFMSVIFWTIVAISLTIDAPHSVSPIILAGLAVGAAVQLAEWKPTSDLCA